MDRYKYIEKLLYEYNSLKTFIKNAQQQIENIQKDVDGVSGVSYNKVSSKTNNTPSIVENEVLKREKKISILQKRIQKTQGLLDRLDRSIEVLNDIEKRIIKLRYMKNLQWYEVSWNVKYSERWCKELKSKAIEKIAVAMFGNIEEYENTV